MSLQPAPIIPPELLEQEGHVYRTETNSLGQTSYILLAETILNASGQPRPSPLHRVLHLNGDSLDNRRANLSWHLPTVFPAPSDN